MTAALLRRLYERRGFWFLDSGSHRQRLQRNGVPCSGVSMNAEDVDKIMDSKIIFWL